jgi:hypothetical protein
MTVNLIVVGLFGLSLWLRTSDSLGGWPAAVSGIELLLLGLGGWLGGSSSSSTGWAWRRPRQRVAGGIGGADSTGHVLHREMEKV